MRVGHGTSRKGSPCIHLSKTSPVHPFPVGRSPLREIRHSVRACVAYPEYSHSKNVDTNIWSSKRTQVKLPQGQRSITQTYTISYTYHKCTSIHPSIHASMQACIHFYSLSNNNYGRITAEPEKVATKSNTCPKRMTWPFFRPTRRPSRLGAPPTTCQGSRKPRGSEKPGFGI